MLSVRLAGGGALGKVARYWLKGLISCQYRNFPTWTQVINVLGPFLITSFATLIELGGACLVLPGDQRFFVTGTCGGYTTSCGLYCGHPIRRVAGLYPG